MSKGETTETPNEKGETAERVGVNGASPRKPTRKQKFNRHCARFWWTYAIAVVVVVLATVLPTVYIAYPNIAQAAINHSDLNVTSQAILAPAPNAFDLHLTAVFLSNASTSAHLHEWTAHLCLDKDSDISFAQLQVPASQASDRTEVHINQRTRIANPTEFVKYTTLALASREYSIYLKGKGGLDRAGLPTTTVSYSKEIRMKGLNALADFAVADFAILPAPLPDGSNANGTVSVLNPSLATYALGNLSMGMSVAGIPIGTATLRNVTLEPGANSVPVTFVTDQVAVAQLILGPYRSSGVLPVDIRAQTVVYNGVNIPWYEQALGAMTLSVQLDVVRALRDAGMADLSSMIPPGALRA